MCEALIYLLDNIYIRFGTQLYRQIVGIPMSTNCAPLVADLFLFCYERDSMTSLSDVKQAEIIGAFKLPFSFAPVFQGVARDPRDLQVSVATRVCRVLISVSSQYLSVIYLFPVMIH